MNRPLTVAFLWLAVFSAPPVFAQDTDDFDRPLVFPTFRYGGPEKLSAGVAIQPLRGADGRWKWLIASASIGRGGAKVGAGVGGFGGSLMTGQAVQVTLLRTMWNPVGAAVNQTFVGLEGELMIVSLSLKMGPSFRVGGGPDAGRRIRFNWSVGLGF